MREQAVDDLFPTIVNGEQGELREKKQLSVSLKAGFFRDPLGRP
jgi:hypothetical protein